VVAAIVAVVGVAAIAAVVVVAGAVVVVVVAGAAAGDGEVCLNNVHAHRKYPCLLALYKEKSYEHVT
jgi:hypothetical protein